MKKILLPFGICVCLGVAVLNVGALTGFEKSNYPKSRQIQYSFTLQNKSNHLLQKVDFWTYAPVKQTSTQLCVGLETSCPYEIIVDNLNNQILHFTLNNIPPYAIKIIDIKAFLKFSDKSVSMPIRDFSHYLQPEKYIESDTPEISRISKEFGIQTPIKTAENIFNWVTNSIKYVGYLRNDRGALYALKNRQGDCTEFMYLFTALCRARNVPARGIGGYVHGENNILNPSDYHNWAEFYDDSVWKLADPQKNVFVKNQSNYIAMRIIGTSPENPMGEHHRFRFRGDGLKVKINKILISRQ